MTTRLVKIISVFTITFLLFTVSFAQSTIITTATSVQACPGTVVVPIRGQDIVGAASISLGLFYDTQYQTYTGYQNVHPALSGGIFFVNDIGGYVKLAWIGFNLANISDDTLIEFIFTYHNCEALMHWNVQVIGECEYTDINNQILPAIFVDGQVSSSAITSQPPDYSATVNQNANFSVTAPGSTTIQWQESTDSLTWSDLTNAGIYSGVNTNTLSITGVPLSMNGYQYRVYVAGGACGDTSCSAYLFVSPTQPVLTTIGIDSSCYSAISVPVDVDEFYSVASFSLKLDYDTNIVIFSSYQNEDPGLLTGILTATASGGQVMIDWNSPTEVDLGSLTLFDLVFLPKPGSSGLSALVWDTIPVGNCEYLKLGGSTIPSYYANGSVKINTLPTPSISGDTAVCEYQTGLVYNTPLVSGNIYNWTVTGGTILFGYANSITVKWSVAGVGIVSVVETDTITGCDSIAADFLVNIHPNPIAFNVTGGGGYCFGGNGSEVGLDGSEINVNYQLRYFSTNVGSPVSGTGSAISFGNFTATGSYSVRASSLNGCELPMSGGVQISIDSLPFLATVTGGGTICIGGSGLEVGIDTSEVGVDYQVFLDGLSFGTPYPGIGGPLSFGIQSDAGTYTVEAINLTTNCVATMVGSATISYTLPPTVDAGSDAAVCEGRSISMAGTATNYAFIGWVTAGDGVFDTITSLHATYSPGLNDITNGTVILTITAFGIGSCGNVNDQMQLTINLSPSIYAGLDDTICPNQAYQLNGTGNNYDQVIWSGGDGIFSDSTILNPTYTPGPGDFINDSVIITLAVYGIYPCDTLIDRLVLYFLPSAIANAGSDATICEGDSYTLIGTATEYTSVSWTGGDGSFDDPSSLNPLYTPGPNDIAGGSVFLTLVAYGNCGYDSDSMVLTINGLPTADAGMDAGICVGQTHSLNGNATNYLSVLWTRSGDGIFMNSTSLNAIYIPGPNDRIAGTVTLTLNVTGIAPCGNTTDDMILTISAAATADAGTDATICEDDTYTLSGSATNYSSVSWTGGDGSFDNNTLLNATYSPGANDIATGTVTLTITALSITTCGNATDDMTLTIIAAPVAAAGMDASICEGESYILNGTAANYLSVSWTGGDGSFDDNTFLNATYSPGANDIATGTVNLILNVNGNSPCGSVMDDMLLTIVAAPVADAGGDAIVCEGDTYSFNVANANNYSTVLWTGGDGSFDDSTSLWPLYTPGPNDLAAGSVIITLTVYGYTPCGNAFDDMVLTVVTAAVSDAGVDAIICKGETHTLSGSASNNTGVSWYTVGDGTFDNSSIPGATYTPGSSDIAAGSVTLTFIAYGIDPPCGDAFDDMVLTINQLPVADAGADQTISYGTSTTLDGTVTGGSGTYTYSWTPVALLIDATVEDPTTVNLDDTTQFDLVVTDVVTGCVSLADVVVVDITGGALTANPQAVPQVICEGDVVTLHSNASGGSGTYTYLWTSNPAGFNSTQQDPTDFPIDNTWYILTVDDGYNTFSDSVLVTVYIHPTADAGADAAICEDATYTLNGLGTSYSNVLWTTTGDGIFDDASLPTATYTPEISDIANGSVTLTFTVFSGNPCGDVFDDMILTINASPAANAGNDTTICEGDCATLIAAGGVSYVWNTGETDASFSVCPTALTTYTVTVADANGCTASDDVVVDVISCGTPVIVRTLLQAPYTGSVTMNTNLNALIPTDQPYNRAPWNYAGVENIASIPANMTDWILLELRDAADPSLVIARRAAVLLDDGNIADIDMASSVNFEGVAAGNYYLCVHHRNHMPVMSANPIAIPNASVYDFSDPLNFPPYGGATQALIELENGVFGMIAGDVNSDRSLKYSGPGNDRGLILQLIVNESGSTSITTTVNGYYDEDINMNGVVKYSGPGNDPSMIIQNLVNLTGSTSITSVFTIPVP
ncbi:MAG: hypothetical protein K8S00_05595 [Bacteroidales bacterium]|nr:hypothetical protein [Bacteroidales bacterium]